MIDLFIAIVNTNNREILHKCLESIFQYTERISYKVGVLDNFSHDGSQEMMREKFPSVELRVNSRRMGLAINWNVLLRDNYQNARYSLILNEDIVLNTNAFNKMVRFMDNHPEIGALGCKLLYPDGRIQVSIGSYPSVSQLFITLGQKIPILSTLKLFLKYSRESWDYNRNQELYNCFPMGCCLMIRREAIEKVGLMDETFSPIYLEETDWCYRIKQAGFKIYYLADAEVIHYHGYTINKLGKEFKDLIQATLYRNRRYFFKKHLGPCAFLIVLIKDLIVFLIFLLKWLGIFIFRQQDRVLAKEKIKFYKELLRAIFKWK